MPDEDAVHVAPLPPDHKASADCSCAPIRSTLRIGVIVFVHRIGDGELSIGWQGPKQE